MVWRRRWGRGQGQGEQTWAVERVGVLGRWFSTGSDSSCNVNLKQFPSALRKSVPHVYMGWRLCLSQRVTVRTNETARGALSLDPGPATCSPPPCHSHAHTHTHTRSSRSWDFMRVLQPQRASACDGYTPNPAPTLGSVHRCPLCSLGVPQSPPVTPHTHTPGPRQSAPLRLINKNASNSFTSEVSPLRGARK